MIIKRFILTVACRDENKVDAKAVEDAIQHGPLADSGPLSVSHVDDDRKIDYPDPDYKLEGTAFDKALDAWDSRAEDEIYDGLGG